MAKAVRRHTLLIVDDEPDVLESLRHLFHRAYRVLTADAGGPAMEILLGARTSTSSSPTSGCPG